MCERRGRDNRGSPGADCVLFQGTTKSSAPRSCSLIISLSSVLRQTLWRGQIASNPSSLIRLGPPREIKHIRRPPGAGNRSEILWVSPDNLLSPEELAHTLG